MPELTQTRPNLDYNPAQMQLLYSRLAAFQEQLLLSCGTEGSFKKVT